MAEVLLVVVAFALPLVVGAVMAFLRRPWWWAALLAIVLFWVAAVAPAPEEGESRVAGGDIVFLLVVSLMVAGLTWLGAWVYRRLGGPARA